ncbi:FMN-binding negative transcriptional regulator [Streptomyces sp. NPDC058294]|uniref:FMN-binding negative transcriptional regulator n=1 Tax=Streptomyces sp. NPDC058294 TaxID=3346430 RepID=UPI0036F16F61
MVPTWNYYITAHVYGRLVVRDDPAWMAARLRRLTDRHEAGSADPGPSTGRGKVRRGAAAGGRRRRARHQPDRGQVQDGPEPDAARRRGSRRGPGGPGPGP